MTEPVGMPGELREADVPLEEIAEPFLRDVVRAVLLAGRDVAVDEDGGTIDVDAHDADLERVLGVVRPLARGVTFYAVHPTRATAESIAAAAELAVRATNDQFDAALELDPATGVLAVRCAVRLGDARLEPAVLGELVAAALDEVEAVAARYREPIEDVLAGRATPAAAAAAGRGAELAAAQQEVDDLVRAWS